MQTLTTVVALTMVRHITKTEMSHYLSMSLMPLLSKAVFRQTVLCLQSNTAFAFSKCLMFCCGFLQVLVAGFFVTNIPDWIGWLRYTSFIFYCYSLLIKVCISPKAWDTSHE